MKTDFEKGQILGLRFGDKDPRTVKKYAKMAAAYSPECFAGFENGIELAIQTLEKILKDKQASKEAI